ncbi:GAF domain-containing protein [Thermohalobacter berrensis]|uniref:GAF domain-containing protein n=1 Tax=Thermohalobacter berrensis TaxID=99594 RepID=A0A419TB07_9FIRM|nr:GAF domain-containing protein [Thermohalobacter berrensis]RKD34669.1 hypothetical protein BET03_02250 [Thermohalobacter berrensis]
MLEIFNKLCDEISQVIEIDEIALLKIQDGYIIPVIKKNTEFLSADEWFDFHEEYESKVENDKFIKRTLEEKKVSVIKDTSNLEEVPIEWKVLGIASIYFFPVIKDDKVVSIVDIAYIKKPYKMTDEQIEKLKEIISKYSNELEI